MAAAVEAPGKHGSTVGVEEGQSLMDKRTHRQGAGVPEPPGSGERRAQLTSLQTGLLPSNV